MTLAVVTGGAKGIGLAITRRLAADGWDVVITGRDEASAAAAAAELTALGGGVVTYVLGDVASKADCEYMAAEAAARNGGIDVLCANAGIFPAARLADMTEADMEIGRAHV